VTWFWKKHDRGVDKDALRLMVESLGSMSAVVDSLAYDVERDISSMFCLDNDLLAADPVFMEKFAQILLRYGNGLPVTMSPFIATKSFLDRLHKKQGAQVVRGGSFMSFKNGLLCSLLVVDGKLVFAGKRFAFQEHMPPHWVCPQSLSVERILWRSEAKNGVLGLSPDKAPTVLAQGTAESRAHEPTMLGDPEDYAIAHANGWSGGQRIFTHGRKGLEYVWHQPETLPPSCALQSLAKPVSELADVAEDIDTIVRAALRPVCFLKPVDGDLSAHQRLACLASRFEGLALSNAGYLGAKDAADPSWQRFVPIVDIPLREASRTLSWLPRTGRLSLWAEQGFDATDMLFELLSKQDRVRLAYVSDEELATAVYAERPGWDVSVSSVREGRSTLLNVNDWARVQGLGGEWSSFVELKQHVLATSPHLDKELHQVFKKHLLDVLRVECSPRDLFIGGFGNPVQEIEWCNAASMLDAPCVVSLFRFEGHYFVTSEELWINIFVNPVAAAKGDFSRSVYDFQGS
jgi:hypothetical protein